MLHKIMAYITENHMIEPGDCIVAGVSGGADSVCLFHLLLALREQLSFSLSVLHVNHGIRSDAGEDAEFVRQLCRGRQVTFLLVEEDVPAYAAAHRIGEEEAGRILRYQAFASVNEQHYGGRAKFAVAHNRDDCAETVLFQLFRGSGPHGLCGMKPVQGNIIRPLLSVQRSEIEAYLAGHEIVFRTDSTNEGDAYARNRIRHHILRYAEREICRGSTGHITHAADMLSSAAQYLDSQTDGAFADCVENDALRDGYVRISAKQFLRLHPYLKGSLIHRCFSQIVPAAKNITSKHVDHVCALFDKPVGRMVVLPGGMRAVRTYEGVCLETAECGNQAACREKPCSGTGCLGEEKMIPVRESACGEVFFEGLLFAYRVFSREGKEAFFETIPKNNCTKWFDYDKIKEPITIRCRRSGDYLAINAAGNRKSIKKYMIDEKIPSAVRESVPLVAQGGHILWVVGYRVSEAYKITADTKRVMEIYVSGGKENGRENQHASY